MAINILLVLIYLQNNYTKAASVQVALTPGPAECGMRIKNKKLNKGGGGRGSRQTPRTYAQAGGARSPTLLAQAILTYVAPKAQRDGARDETAGGAATGSAGRASVRITT